jgi:hypothetical protein
MLEKWEPPYPPFFVDFALFTRPVPPENNLLPVSRSPALGHIRRLYYRE